MTTMWPKVTKTVLTLLVSWKSCHSLEREQILRMDPPLSESGLVVCLKKERLWFMIMLLLLWWLHKACFCHVVEMFLQTFSDWLRLLRHMFNWPVSYRLYVTMSQASSGPAGHDLMDPSNPLLRDPYITCRYRRHNTPQEPQAPPMTFTLLSHDSLIWAGIKLRVYLMLAFSRSKTNLITEDLVYRTSWYKGEVIEFQRI